MVQDSFIDLYKIAADAMEIKEESYSPKARVISSKDSSFTFNLIYNPYRESRPEFLKKSEDCPLCEGVREAKLDPRRILLATENFIVTPNKFPTLASSSIAIYNTCTNPELPMYRTTNLEGFEKVLAEYLEISQKLGISLFHNTPGAGSSIPGHEHCHFHDFSRLYNSNNSSAGLNAATVEKVKQKRGVHKIEGYPFPHLVFDKDPNRIVNFLTRLNSQFGQKYTQTGLPFLLSEFKSGVLCVPVKNYIEGKGVGSGDVAGNLLTKSPDEFEKADYAYCLNRLRSTLFEEGSLDLESLV